MRQADELSEITRERDELINRNKQLMKEVAELQARDDGDEHDNDEDERDDDDEHDNVEDVGDDDEDQEMREVGQQIIPPQVMRHYRWQCASKNVIDNENYRIRYIDSALWNNHLLINAFNGDELAYRSLYEINNGNVIGEVELDLRVTKLTKFMAKSGALSNNRYDNTRLTGKDADSAVIEFNFVYTDSEGNSFLGCPEHRTFSDVAKFVEHFISQHLSAINRCDTRSCDYEHASFSAFTKHLKRCKSKKLDESTVMRNRVEAQNEITLRFRDEGLLGERRSAGDFIQV